VGLFARLTKQRGYAALPAIRSAITPPNHVHRNATQSRRFVGNVLHRFWAYHHDMWIALLVVLMTGQAADQPIDPKPTIKVERPVKPPVRVVNVAGDQQLRLALRGAQPGDVIKVAPGQYKGGLYYRDLRHVTLEGANPDAPPVFRGGNTGLHFASCEHLTLRHLVVEGAADNGINIDDGGKMDGSARHIRIEHVTVRNVGPRGNRDGIKLSGLANFEVRDCHIENWGDGGSGIDMVGCHFGLIRDVTLKHKSNTSASSGIQAKGGTRNIEISLCYFDHAGRRAVNLGGSTGDQYFRPKLDEKDNVEAEKIVVVYNTFVGSESPINFVTSVNCTVMSNLIYRPGKWVVRVLQEKPLEKFKAAGHSMFSWNVVVWKSGDIHRFVNVGKDTNIDSFDFDDNYWYCIDKPAQSKPRLPIKASYMAGTNPLVTTHNGRVLLSRDTPIPFTTGEGRWPTPEDDDE
jgi:hypothetical protein